jgi:hypothetical protein
MVLTPGVAAWTEDAAPKTTASAPTMGQINRYNATAGPLTVPLPALASLNEFARTMVQKDKLDVSANTVTFNRTGADVFDDASTSMMLSTSGESRTLQVVKIGGVKKWKITEEMAATVSGGGGGGGGGGTSSDSGVFYAASYGVIADGAAHNNVANLLDCFAEAYAASASEVVLPAGVIYTGDANLGAVTATSGASYTNNGGIPLPINKALTVTGHSKGVTTLKLSAGFTRGFDFGPWTADGQIYRNITIRGITFDRNSLSGTTIGPLSTITSNVTIPGDGTPTVLPGVSATTWRNAKWAYAPGTNAGTLRNLGMWVGISGSNVVATNYYGTSYTLNTGDQIGAKLGEHVIVGTSIWGGDGFHGGQGMTIKDILVDSCEVTNAVTVSAAYGVQTSDRSFGVGISLINGAGQSSCTNFTMRNTDLYGGAYGAQISGAAGTWLDNVWYVDCFHDTLLTPTINYEAANFMVGYYAWVGRAGAIRCRGRRSGDVAWEIDQPWEGHEEDCVWEDAWQGSYRSSFQPPARTAAGPVATTLNNGGTLTSGASTCTVTSLPSGVDRSGLARIDTELVWYQASNLAGTTWNIWRGINGSTAASHTTSAAVTFVETHKTRVHSIRSTIRNSAVMAGTGSPGRAWSAFTNSNLPLPPLTIRDPNVTILGGDLNPGQLMYQDGWCPDMDIQGLRMTQSSLLSAKTSSDIGTAISLVSSGTTAFVTNSVPAPPQKLTGRNNKLHIHGKAPNTSSGSYAALLAWDGYWKYDLDLEAEVSLADVPNTYVAYLQNAGAFSGKLVVAPGSRLNIIGRAPTEFGVTAPIGLLVGSTTYVTIQSLLNATLDVTSNFTPTSIDSTQSGKVITGNNPVGEDYLPAGFATMSRIGALNDLATTSGRLALQYITADKTAVVSTMRALSWSTAAAATPTLIRFGIYSVATNGDLTLIGSTANDTTLFAGTFQAQVKALSAATTLIQGNRYVLAFLIVSSAAMPTVLGSYIADPDQSPRLAGIVTGQTNLPSTITAGTVASIPGYAHYLMAY